MLDTATICAVSGKGFRVPSLDRGPLAPCPSFSSSLAGLPIRTYGPSGILPLDSQAAGLSLQYLATHAKTRMSNILQGLLVSQLANVGVKSTNQYLGC